MAKHLAEYYSYVLQTKHLSVRAKLDFHEVDPISGPRESLNTLTCDTRRRAQRWGTHARI